MAKKLRAPLSEGGPPMIDVLKSSGILTDETHALTLKFLEQIDRFYTGKTVTGAAKLPGQEKTVTNMLQKALVRLAALHGAAVTPVIDAGPGSLSAAHTVANTADKILNSLPDGKIIDALIEGMSDPKLGALMLENMDKLPAKDVFKLASRIHGYLFGAGLIPIVQEVSE